VCSYLRDTERGEGGGCLTRRKDQNPDIREKLVVCSEVGARYTEILVKNKNVYIFMYVYIYMCVYIYMDKCIYMCMYTHTYVYICVYTYICIYIRIYVCMYMYICVLTCILTCIYICIYFYIYVYIIYTHIYIIHVGVFLKLEHNAPQYMPHAAMRARR